MRRRVIALVSLIIVMWASVAWAAVPLPQVGAEAAVLMVADTKQVLFAKKPDGLMYPASTTKIMTLITALENGDQNQIVTVSPHAAACEESRLGLKAGDQLTLSNAMNGMMLISGNDAAEAIAENVAGSIPQFVKLMNANAEKIGAVNTHFSNPHGLPDPYNHYSTAYDLALITNYALKNPDFAKIVSTKEYDVTFLNDTTIHVENIDRMLRTYPGATGVKTGYTHDAGPCLVSSAKRGGVQLIAVLLNDDQRWSDATKLLNYGFDQLGL